MNPDLDDEGQGDHSAPKGKYKTDLTTLESMSMDSLEKCKNNALCSNEMLEQYATDFVVYREFHAAAFMSMIGAAMDGFMDIRLDENKELTLKKWKEMTASLTDFIVNAVTTISNETSSSPSQKSQVDKEEEEEEEEKSSSEEDEEESSSESETSIKSPSSNNSSANEEESETSDNNEDDNEERSESESEEESDPSSDSLGSSSGEE